MKRNDTLKNATILNEWMNEWIKRIIKKTILVGLEVMSRKSETENVNFIIKGIQFIWIVIYIVFIILYTIMDWFYWRNNRRREILGVVTLIRGRKDFFVWRELLNFGWKVVDRKCFRPLIVSAECMCWDDLSLLWAPRVWALLISSDLFDCIWNGFLNSKR